MARHTGKEFDKSFVDLDIILSDLSNDFENGDLIEDNILEFVESSRDKVRKMCSAWTQLVHKSQTIFQVNCKLEVNLLKTIFSRLDFFKIIFI